jgi:hypothetical protein
VKPSAPERLNASSLSEGLTMRQWLALWMLAALLIGYALVLMACQTTGSGGTEGPSSASAACRSFTPIYWSKTDSVETQRQAIAHNAAWSKLCAVNGNPPP